MLVAHDGDHDLRCAEHLWLDEFEFSFRGFCFGIKHTASKQTVRDEDSAGVERTVGSQARDLILDEVATQRHNHIFKHAQWMKRCPITLCD